MANTYTQLYIQMVFAVKHRQNFIQPSWKEMLYKYITGAVQNDKHKMLAINGMPDHIHIFIGLNPAFPISDVVKDIKRASNNWMNNNQLINGKFEWQSGYGHFHIAGRKSEKFAPILKSKRNIIKKLLSGMNTQHC